MSGLDLKFNPALDSVAIARELQSRGRVHVPQVLTEASASALYACIAAETQWNLVTLAGRKHYDLNAQAAETMGEDKRRLILDAAHAEAREGFGYLYETFPLYDIWHARSLPDHPLMDLFGFLNGEDMLGFARAITAADDIGFADAQVTRYRAGHFLTLHDDHVAGKHRRAAYVLNLTPRWRPDWGGQLLFFDEAGHVTGGFTPTFNALNVFLIPVRHSVSVVAPYCREARYSITGWLRAGQDHGP